VLVSIVVLEPLASGSALQLKSWYHCDGGTPIDLFLNFFSGVAWFLSSQLLSHRSFLLAFLILYHAGHVYNKGCLPLKTTAPSQLSDPKINTKQISLSLVYQPTKHDCTLTTTTPLTKPSLLPMPHSLIYCARATSAANPIRPTARNCIVLLAKTPRARKPGTEKQRHEPTYNSYYSSDCSERSPDAT
jgi:hypothetical protein